MEFRRRGERREEGEGWDDIGKPGLGLCGRCVL